MHKVSSISDVQRFITTKKSLGAKIAFVPTMGNLHDGHLSLVEQAKKKADCVIVSIYVNPLQFGQNEDYSSYPKTLEQDCALLEKRSVSLVYTAHTQEIYPQGSKAHTHVSVNALDGMHCGKSRPCFFSGIATVVTKLFNIVKPDIAFFGEKDFQQLAIIRKMVSDLCIPVNILSVPTVRENSGLAMSSRNNYLTKEEREIIAPTLFKILNYAKVSIKFGEYGYDKLSKNAIAMLAESGIKPDYFNICNPNTLLPAVIGESDIVILAAGYLNKTRLIDNIHFSIKP